ncbi:UNVERIFIED_CONTAM: hypothetical protein FKN15_077335 [Acipenser sinensis]
MPQWVQQCTKVMRAMSLSEMGGNLPHSVKRKLWARSSDNLASTGDPLSHSVGTIATLKGKMSKRLSIVKGHFPKLIDCAHFHYENVDFGPIQLQFANDPSNDCWTLSPAKDAVFLVQVSCQGKTWLVRRTYEEFRTLDSHLHQCIYDRRYSQLDQLPPIEDIDETVDIPRLSEYLGRLSMIVDNKLNCGPVLTWMEIDNRGNQFLLKEEASLNVPAIGAAHVTKRYTAQANDEISIEVGDILSVIDMPPKEETSWWRGKHGFQVGFFPNSDNCSSKAGIVSVPGPNSPSSGTNAIHTPRSLCACGGPVEPELESGSFSSQTSLSESGASTGSSSAEMDSPYKPPQPKVPSATACQPQDKPPSFSNQAATTSSSVPELSVENQLPSKKPPAYSRQFSAPHLQHKHPAPPAKHTNHHHHPQFHHSKCKSSPIIHNSSHLRAFQPARPKVPPKPPELNARFPLHRNESYSRRSQDQARPRMLLASQSTPPFSRNDSEGVCYVDPKTHSHLDQSRGFAASSVQVYHNRASSNPQIFAGSHEFDSEIIPELTGELYMQDIHCVGSLCKLYFRELPNPLLTYQLYDKFADIHCVGSLCKLYFRELPNPLLTYQLYDKFAILDFCSSHIMPRKSAVQSKIAVMCTTEEATKRKQQRRKSGMKVRKSAGGSWRAFFAIGKTPGSQQRKSARVGSLFQASQAEMGLSKHQRLRRPRSSSDALSVTMETELLSTLKHCRSYDSVQAEDPEGVYMLPDFSHEASLWLAEDEMDFSPTYLDEAGLELEPLTFRCGPQRLVTEDPDSLMNQSEVAVRKSFINQPPQRVQSCCQQHKTSAVMNPLTQTSEITSPAPEKLSKSTSFTRKMVHALSPKGNKSPPMDISEPISITVPAKVLEMIGGRAGEFQSASGAQNLATAAAQPPQMISMLLRSCDIQLTESCQQEIRSKLSFTESKVKGHSVPSFQLSEHSRVMDHSQLQAGFLMAAAPLPSQVPPPPPPKNPARLMALALAESANKAMKQSQREPHPQGGEGASLEARFMRSLSVDSNECLSSVANPLYSTVRSLSVWKPERGPQLQSEKGDSDGQKHIRSQPQESGSFSSQTSLSESGASTGSSSAEMDSPYKPPQPKVPSATACQPQDKPPSFSNQAATTSSSVPELSVENQLPRKKPPAYSRQFSAPHLQHKHPAPPTKHTNHHHHPQFHHSKCKSSPIIHSSSHLRAFQPARPKVPPKPPELNAGFPLHRNESYSRRSQDQTRPRMLLASQSTPPFSRNDSEGVCYVDPKTHSHLDQSRGFAASSVQVYHNRASSNPQIFAGRSEDENFYYEIAPEPSFVQIPRYNYQNVGNQMAFEGVPYRLPRPGFEHAVADRNLRSHDISVRPHLWTGISQNLNPTVDRSLAMQGNAAGCTQIAGIPYSTVPQESPAHQPSAPFRMVPVSRTEGAPNQGTSTYQRNLYRTQRSPSADLSASQLHPYFENGKVCYRYLEEGAAHEGETRVLQDYRPQAAVSAPKPPRLQEQPEPIYVNFPFNPGKAWTTTNLDGDQHSEPPPNGSSNDRSGTDPPLVFEENIASQESSSDPWQRAGSSVVSQYDNFSPSLDEKPQGSEAIHFRSKSDPGNGGIEGPGELQNLEEKDHVNHPTETPASESGSNGASRCLATLCEMPSHPQQQQPSLASTLESSALSNITLASLILVLYQDSLSMGMYPGERGWSPHWIRLSVQASGHQQV